jgi:DNA-binding MarR family transcriptional regulator
MPPRTRGPATDRVGTGRQLIQLAQVIVRLEERVLHDISISYRQMRIIKHVHGGAESATALGAYFGITAPAISETLESLVKKGLLRREPHPDDRRSVRLLLTKAGEEMYRRSQAAEDDLSLEILDAVSDTDLKRLEMPVAAMLERNQDRLIMKRRRKA